ncbi:hypothetical protein AXF42_Ash004972 [Apostasia shenzhenica]|uniref:Uncharacterized protein n=1 Tax=Apostasia shenzhenica TaxID=1088818 RepID=A0A2I0B852_9ASPA|nr:hypothetical protein AXF42_Ash004972 [Apostasia shenzhenica]
MFTFSYSCSLKPSSGKNHRAIDNCSAIDLNDKSVLPIVALLLAPPQHLVLVVDDSDLAAVVEPQEAVLSLTLRLARPPPPPPKPSQTPGCSCSPLPTRSPC